IHLSEHHRVEEFIGLLFFCKSPIQSNPIQSNPIQSNPIPFLAKHGYKKAIGLLRNRWLLVFKPSSEIRGGQILLV
ncbi:MAG: hypothetical protein LAT67_14100, partial [Balneolales bacterium]|nr:hypothetical protein [Balneolales bacterium]